MMELFRSIFAPPRDLILPILGAWLGLVLAEKRTTRHQVSEGDLNSLVLNGMISFVIAGRLVHVLENLPAFIPSPLSLFSPNPDLFDLPGAILGAALSAAALCRWRKIPILNALDALAPFFAVLATGIALMHLAAGTAFGQLSDVPWAIDLWGARRHPSQIYEALAALIILLWTWSLSQRARPGIHFLFFASLSAGSRLLLEAFRGDSTFLPGGFRQAQVAALAILTGCFVLFEIILQRPDEPAAGDADNQSAGI